MLDATTVVPAPVNEPIRHYPPGSPERASLEARLKELAAEPVDLTLTIAGATRPADGDAIEVVQPHRHTAVLGTTHEASAADWTVRSRPRSPPHRPGAVRRTTTGRPSCCARRSCSPARGGTP